MREAVKIGQAPKRSIWLLSQIDLKSDGNSGKLTLVAKLDKRIQAFQEKMRCPKKEQQLANVEARMERDRLRQKQNRRAAGIPPRGAQEELEKATGYRDDFGRLNEMPF